MKITVAPWLSSAMSRWQTSFPLEDGVPKSELGFGSTLEFQDPHDLLYLLSAEFHVHKRVSFELQYADSSGIAGRGRDHDWLDAPNEIVTVSPSGDVYTTPHQTDMSLSENTLSGRTTYLAVNGYGRIYQFDSDSSDDTLSHQYLDVLLGFTVYDDRFRMKNLRQVISTGDLISTPAPGDYPGLDSTFHFHWQGFQLGAREDVGLMRLLRGVITGEYSPFMSYRGDGFWNLRSDLSSSAPNFVQSASGSMVEGRFSLVYDPWPFLDVELGYMILYFRSHQGTITSYKADGSTVSQDLDSAWSERKGLLTSVAFRF